MPLPKNWPKVRGWLIEQAKFSEDDLRRIERWVESSLISVRWNPRDQGYIITFRQGVKFPPNLLQDLEEVLRLPSLFGRSPPEG